MEIDFRMLAKYFGGLPFLCTTTKLLLAVCVFASLASCGTSRTTSQMPQTESSTQTPSLEELTDFLSAELVRLGKDPGKTVAAAPSGPGNAVFDLSAAIHVGSGIELVWTERIIGDYDQNGEVNLADLAPLAINWVANVDYDDPALHGGFTGWPTGDPDGAGAANWLMARIDGDSNGEVSNSDITSIALHFQERIDGYRIYRKAPGETGFTMLAPPAPVEADVTLAHPASPGNAPVRYSLSDNEATPGGLSDGVYQYYVASYDKVSGAESPASGIVHVNLVTGTVNQSPVAQLSISPGFAGAPAEITLDASASYDPDGTVAAYEWDFDSDGEVDWLSTDPLPDESSNAIVDSITEVSPGVVTARYFEGSADWYYPTVVVVDAEALESVPATEQLGISGWISTVLNESKWNYLVPFEPQLISVDPGNGDVVVVSSKRNLDYPETMQFGMYFARETQSGPWDVEFIEVPGLDPDTGGSGSRSIKEIYWDESGQPIIFFDIRVAPRPMANLISTLWYAQRKPDGIWEVVELHHTTHPDGDPTLSDFMEFSQRKDGTIVIIATEDLYDKPGLSFPDHHVRYFIITYANGAWKVHDSLADTAETYWWPRQVAVLPNDDVYITYLPMQTENEVWWSPWSEENGLLERERIDDGSTSISGWMEDIVVSDSGTIYSLYENNYPSDRCWLLTFDDSGTTSVEFVETDSNYSDNVIEPEFLHADGDFLSYFRLHYALALNTSKHYVEYITESDQQRVRELIMSHPMFETTHVRIFDAEYPINSMPYCLIGHYKFGDPLEPPLTGYRYRVCERVDPRK